MTTFDAVVLRTIEETPDARTLVFDLTPASADYRAGQFVTIDPHQFPGLRGFVDYLEHLKGRKEAPRAYSMCSAPNEPHVAVTVKEEFYEAGRTKYPPLLSGFLVHQLRPGDRLAIRGYAGGYTLPDDVVARSRHVLHLCAGSGSVPNLSILKDSLHRHARLRHTFLYSNRTWRDVIFRDELAEIRARHPDRLRVVHSLTREPDPAQHGGDVRTGRIGPDLLREVLSVEPDSLVYVCGPAVTVRERRQARAEGIVPAPRFIETMLSHLETLGVARERIKVESYG